MHALFSLRLIWKRIGEFNSAKIKIRHKKEKRNFFLNMYTISDVSGGGKREGRFFFSVFSFLLISNFSTVKFSGREYGNWISGSVNTTRTKKLKAMQFRRDRMLMKKVLWDEVSWSKIYLPMKGTVPLQAIYACHFHCTRVIPGLAN